ncbi:MAG: aminopeptidase [Gemmatimonadales bacterium]|nr:aminopeptidase [Gemmatimonadales bacterium]
MSPSPSRRLRLLLLGLSGALLTVLLASRDVRFVLRAAAEEARILWRRRPIADVLADPGLSAERRGLLRIVLDARDFAATLGFAAGTTYRQYTDLGRDTLVLNVTAAPRDRLEPYTWWFPVVGRVPYKGFFDLAAARAEASALEARGYDTYLWPAAAFSTLGWFEDPLLSTALARDSVEMAALVFHELAHNTLWVPGAVPFNESFAQYAGYAAAEAFFRARGDGTLARRAADRFHDEQALGRFYARLVARLDSAYATRPTGEALERVRAEAGRWARAELAGPVAAELRVLRVGPLADRPVNNARLVGVLTYRTRLDAFAAWHARHGADVRASVAALRAVVAGAPGDSAFARLDAALR